MKAVNFCKPDKIPLWNVLHFDGFITKWREYINADENTDPSGYYDYDTVVCSGDECFFPSRKEIITDAGEYTIMNDGWGRIIKTKKTGYFVQTLDTLIKKPSDIDKLDFDSTDSEIRFGALYETIKKEQSNNRCIYSKAGGIYNRSHNLLPEEELLVYMLLDEDFCNELFDRVSAYLTSIAVETLKRTKTWDTGLFVYDDMATTYSPIFSPEMFEKYFLPRYKKMIGTIRSAGCSHFYFHSDGNISPLIDMLLDAGFEGFNPLEPRSGQDLYLLRDKYGDRIVFFGGVCNTRILPKGDRKEIEAHIRPLIELGREGGLILGTASISDDVSPQAYDYYMSIVKKYGNYSEQ